MAAKIWAQSPPSGPDFRQLPDNVFSVLRRRLASRGPILFTHAVFTTMHAAPSWAGSWLGVWRAVAGSDDTSCAFEGCSSTATVGSHVTYSGSFFRTASWYIVPACSACNRAHGLSAPLKAGSRVVRVVKGGFRNTVLSGTIDATECERIPLQSLSARFPDAAATAAKADKWRRAGIGRAPAAFHAASLTARAADDRRALGFGWRGREFQRSKAGGDALRVDR